MIVEYESIADVSFYLYFVKSGTPIPNSKGCYTIKASPHFHRNIEFLFVTKGTQKVTVDGKAHFLNAGDILFVNSYQAHSYDNCDAEAFILVLSTTFFEPFVWFNGKKIFPELMDDKEKNADIFAFVEDWYNECKGNESNYDVFIRCNELFRLITQKYEIQEPVLSRQNELVIEALKYIGNHFCDPDLTLKSCSNAIGYSKEHVSKQFNNIMGVSFKSYVNNLRIKKYRAMELNEKGTKQELAVECGFKSISTFYRALKSEQK